MAPELGLDLRVFPVGELMSGETAHAVATLVQDSVQQYGQFTIALSGGQTPRRLYSVLARHYRDAVPWQRLHVFWGDERYVPIEQALSNYRMACETLLHHVPLPPQNIHPMPTTAPTPEDAASVHEAELRECFGSLPPRFGLVLLRLGADGHIASLFPGSEALYERERSVVAVKNPSSGPPRLTLTFPPLSNASFIYFLILGKDKAKALEQSLASEGDLLLCPARGIRPRKGKVVLWADSEAASLIRLDPS